MDFEAKVDAVMMARIRNHAMALEGSGAQRAREMRSMFPTLAPITLEERVKVAVNLTEKVFAHLIEGRISFGVARNLSREEVGMQEFLAEECVAGRLEHHGLIKVKQYLREGQSVTEALARVRGEIPPHEDRRLSPKKSLETVLDDIAKTGARWRSLVSMAMEAVRESELALGVHLDLFEKVFLLRHLIGEQYEFVDQKVRRYLTMMKKRTNGGAGSSSRAGSAEEQGGYDGGGSGREGRDPREVGDGGEAGPVVQDQPHAGEGEGR